MDNPVRPSEANQLLIINCTDSKIQMLPLMIFINKINLHCSLAVMSLSLF